MTSIESPILCATDLTASGARALDMALSVGNALGLPVVLVHAIDGALTDEAAAMDLDIVSHAEQTLRERLRGRAERAREELAREAARVEGAISNAIFVEGRPSEAIVRYAAQIDAAAIVVGPHVKSSGASETAARIVGSTADQILRTAGCPVFVATGRDSSRELRNSTFIVGVDLGPCSRHALETASAFAMRANAEVHVVHVRSKDESATESDMTTLIDDTKARYPNVIFQKSERSGEAVFELSAAAHETRASLIVVGTHGRRGIIRAVLGSVAEATLRMAEVPVLVISPPR